VREPPDSLANPSDLISFPIPQFFQCVLALSALGLPLGVESSVQVHEMDLHTIVNLVTVNSVELFQCNQVDLASANLEVYGEVEEESPV
jgi:hypothetical protein